jgi:hypothetical protein
MYGFNASEEAEFQGLVRMGAPSPPAPSPALVYLVSDEFTVIYVKNNWGFLFSLTGKCRPGKCRPSVFQSDALVGPTNVKRTLPIVLLSHRNSHQLDLQHGVQRWSRSLARERVMQVKVSDKTCCPENIVLYNYGLELE